MAHMTAEQGVRVRDLRTMYGEESRLSIEHTDAPYGIVWMRWLAVESHTASEIERNLFIRPDGERLTWRTL